MRSCQMGVGYEAFYGVQHCEEPAVARWTFGASQDPFYACEEHDAEILEDMKDFAHDPTRTMRTTLEAESE